MIKNIVFDMGQVIIRFDPELFLDRYDLSSEEKNLLNREVFRSVEWVMTDHGKMNTTEAASSICKRIPEKLRDTVKDLICNWFEPLIVVDGIEMLIRELKEKGYGIWLLSNAGLNQPSYWKRLPFSGVFDGTMISAEVGLLKPDPRIYKCFTDQFGLDPEECLFIDDNPMNVEAATGNGWQGIVFHGDVDELRQKAARLGVQCFI